MRRALVIALVLVAHTAYARDEHTPPPAPTTDEPSPPTWNPATSSAPPETAPPEAPDVAPTWNPATTTAPPGSAPPASTPREEESPFAFADFTWVSGNGRTHDSPLTWGKYFIGELRLDTSYTYSFNHPKDDTIVGSSEVFRHGELQLTQLGVGGDFDNGYVHARFMTQLGMYSQTTPAGDTSSHRGQWNLAGAARYLSEAFAGYHLSALRGINLQAGIFLSYIGLWSYYQHDNWTYQPSFVSSNTPWYFSGARIQIFVTDRFKVEPWLVNGWESYGRFNTSPGGGLQMLYRPTGSVHVVGSQYGGSDTLGVPGRKRFHTDESVVWKFYDAPDSFVSKGAVSLTVNAGCEDGGGVRCSGQYFLGFMSYVRWWLYHDLFGITVGGGAIDNPGRYLVLMPPINGANPFTGTPYFATNPGQQFKAWDADITFDWMPQDHFTLRLEGVHRHASVPYFSGPGGVTPPGGNQGPLGSAVDGWAPDLRKTENRITIALLVRM